MVISILISFSKISTKDLLNKVIFSKNQLSSQSKLKEKQNKFSIGKIFDSNIKYQNRDFFNENFQKEDLEKKKDDETLNPKNKEKIFKREFFNQNTTQNKNESIPNSVQNIKDLFDRNFSLNEILTRDYIEKFENENKIKNNLTNFENKIENEGPKKTDYQYKHFQPNINNSFITTNSTLTQIFDNILNSKKTFPKSNLFFQF